jgi:surfeit locus 1 family protein
MESRPRAPRALLLLVAIAALAGFVALGNWQLERRLWKLSLIERVERCAEAPAVPAPAPSTWTSGSGPQYEYCHVVVQGRFLPDVDALVAAGTELGTGYWVMSPLRTDGGSVVLINRGFIPLGAEASPVPEGTVTVAGLLRLSEPGGGVLRDNEPENGRWYSRDVAAIAAVQGFHDAAPYFIDAAADAPGSAGEGGPVGGLTVIRFHNSHLVYAITWYGLAAMVLLAVWLVRREERSRASSGQS